MADQASVAHRIPAFGFAVGLNAESEGSRVTQMVLVGDEEDVATLFDAVEDVKPAVSLARDNFQRGMSLSFWLG